MSATNLDPAAQIAAIRAVMREGRGHDKVSDGPAERVIAQADLDDRADRECEREERWLAS